MPSRLAARCARAVALSSAHRGRGERRVAAAPAASCALVVVESTRVTTSTPESPDVPARNGFTTYFVLSPVTGLFCHRHLRIKVLSKPGRADSTSANLTPASGRQDHTTSPYAATSLVRVLLTAHGFKEPALRSRRAQNAAASTASLPAFVTIAIRPSCGVGWREFVEMICPTGEAKYFCKWGWTPLSTNCPTGKSLDCDENTFLVSWMPCSAISAFTRRLDALWLALCGLLIRGLANVSNLRGRGSECETTLPPQAQEAFFGLALPRSENLQSSERETQRGPWPR
jgi:hypothetical protein